jgi:hypothetical protein
MRHDKRHILWDREDHPSQELLQQYREETLPPALAHQLERHLLDCALCSDVLEGQALSETARIDAAEKDLNQRIAATFQPKKRSALPLYLSDWRVAAAIVLALCSAVLVFYYNYKAVTQQAQGIAAESDRALEEAMDLGEKPAIASPERLAEAAPDTVRQTIDAAQAPSGLKPGLARKSPPQHQEILIDNPIIASELFEVTEAIPEPEVAAAPPATIAQAAKSMAYEEKQAFVTESTAVSKALQGRAAGVMMNRANSAASVGLRQVRGQVLSSDGEPLPGVAVVVKGTTTGVATDAQGNFTLELPGDKATLAFRFIGYETKERAVDANAGPITVDLQVDTRALSEVVVSGYGSSSDKHPVPVMVAAKPGIGSRAYRKYLEENIRYTSASTKGHVVVQATVSPTGALQNLQVIRSLCPVCDEEALRLVGQGPAWKPATSNGTKTEQEVQIVVRFNPEKK